MHSWGNRLEPGDLILVRETSPVGRRTTAFDRMGLVVAVNTVPVEEPNSLRVAVSRALRSPAAQPLVLRPTWRSQTVRDAFVSWFEGMVAARGQQTWRTPRLVFRLMLKHSLRAAMPLERVPIDRASWDTCRAVFIALDRQGRELVELASTGAPRRPPPPRPRGGAPEPTASTLSWS
jgi:hypothetical protein